MSYNLKVGDFEDDDYEEINEKYFNEILKDETWSALPAGWHNPHSVAAQNFVSPHLTPLQHQHYALDEGNSLKKEKLKILNIVSSWESRELSINELTICPSVSSANLALLCALKYREIKRIVFETPAYFATIDQAKILGFEVDRIRSERASGFEAPIERFIESANESTRSAVWLTHPRFGIGIDSPIERLRAIGNALGQRHVLVIDEAAEQRYPSNTSKLGRVPCDILRTRGLLKGVGLNGIRLSVILHPASWRTDIEQTLEIAGASIDRYAIASINSIANNRDLLPAMLRAANNQVCNSRRRLERMLIGSWAQPTPLANGYIGSIFLDFSILPGDFSKKREIFIETCKNMKMPIVLRSSIGFAYEPVWEAIRINYFTPEDNITATGHILKNVFKKIKSRHFPV